MLILHRQQVGIAFSAAIVGALLSTAMSTALDISVPHWCTKNHDGTVPEEYRMLPAMVGAHWLRQLCSGLLGLRNRLSIT